MSRISNPWILWPWLWQSVEPVFDSGFGCVISCVELQWLEALEEGHIQWIPDDSCVFHSIWMHIVLKCILFVCHFSVSWRRDVVTSWCRDVVRGFQICSTLSVWSCAVGAMYYSCRLSSRSFGAREDHFLFDRRVATCCNWIPCEADVSAVRVNLSDSAQAPSRELWDIFSFWC